MAAPQGPVCEVRLLVVHRYAPGVQKLGSTPCEVEFFGRRGKPVKKMRLIPAEKAFAFARKLQGTPGCRLVAGFSVGRLTSCADLNLSGAVPHLQRRRTDGQS